MLVETEKVLRSFYIGTIWKFKNLPTVQQQIIIGDNINNIQHKNHNNNDDENGDDNNDVILWYPVIAQTGFVLFWGLLSQLMYDTKLEW